VRTDGAVTLTEPPLWHRSGRFGVSIKTLGVVLVGVEGEFSQGGCHETRDNRPDYGLSLCRCDGDPDCEGPTTDGVQHK
jgi:hypothetical protein